MKILITGLLVFICWSSLSTWLYVCKIKGLCGGHETIIVSPIKVNDAFVADSLPNTLAEMPAFPENVMVYFPFDKSVFISDSGISKYYDASTAYMVNNPDAKVQITGHTDSKGSDEYNQALGLRRARSVLDYFEGKGIPAGKLTIESRGETEPAENNSTDEGRSKNRRVTVTIKK